MEESDWGFVLSNVTRGKRRFRVRGIHDLKTVQQVFGMAGSSCELPTTWSSISGGREGDLHGFNRIC